MYLGLGGFVEVVLDILRVGHSNTGAWVGGAFEGVGWRGEFRHAYGSQL